MGNCAPYDRLKELPCDDCIMSNCTMQTGLLEMRGYDSLLYHMSSVSARDLTHNKLQIGNAEMPLLKTFCIKDE